MGLEENIDRLEDLNRQSLQGGGDTRIARQHELGKKTAGERVRAFMDPDDFMELDRLKTHRCSDFDMAETKIPGGFNTAPSPFVRIGV